MAVKSAPASAIRAWSYNAATQVRVVIGIVSVGDEWPKGMTMIGCWDGRAPIPVAIDAVRFRGASRGWLDS